ncbi:MAG: high-potential iron-sulfur protein [Pseudomonadota bacterium]
MSKIARRKFIQLSAVAAAGVIASRPQSAVAEGMPKVSEDDPMAKGLKYTHDASTVDPASRVQAAEVQTCDNCMLIQGNEGDAWRPCQLFPGKLVAGAGWCSAWAPKP